MRAHLFAITVAAISAVTPLAGAQDAPPSPAGEPATSPAADEARDRARALANDGLRAFRRGDYVEALARFEEAEGLVPAPTIALHRARSLEKLGRLAEALERYAAIAGAAVAADAPYVHHRAKQDAQIEMAALEPRVPTLTITVEGKVGGKLELLVDGRAVPLSGASAVARLDPGRHSVEVRRRDGTRATQAVELAAGERTTLRLALPPPRGKGAPAEEEEDDDEGAATGERRRDPASWDGDDQRAAGWVALSAGGVGLGIALITGAAAIVQGSDLDARCPDGACPPSAHADVDEHDAYRAASTVGWIFAGAFAATGVVLLLTAPDDDGPAASAAVGPRGVAVRVSY